MDTGDDNMDALEELLAYSADDLSVDGLDDPSEPQMLEPCLTKVTSGNEHMSSDTTYAEPCAHHGLTRSVTAAASFVLFSCYSFVEADGMWRLSPQDASFLENRGCFHLPAKPALDEFVTQYFRHVHPVLPLLNELEFWTMYLVPRPPSDAQARLSLFLFQAILFVSCPYVPASTLRSLGFPTVRRARGEFYSRAKALFDIDTYRNDVANAQGALMLTYHALSNDDKTNTYWLSTAVHFARNAGADQYAAVDDTLQRKRSSLKRLWWCCILRDRIMALGLRRSLHIRSTEFDFSQTGLTESDFQDEIRGSMVYNPATKQVLAQLAVSFCELAVALNDSLTFLYPVGGTNARSGDPRQTERYLEACSAGLHHWYEKTVAKFHIPTQMVGIHDALILFTDMLYIYYHTAKVSISNQSVLFSITHPSVYEGRRDRRLEAQEELDRSLRCITEHLVELENLDLVKYLPNTFVAFYALPFVWYSLDATLTSTGSRTEDVLRDLKIYAEVMKAFENLYETTDSVLQCVEKTG
ncbi:C6 zinc finger domain containing protein [Pleurostoma richardsiae]|uniref:C6 zinc finger domain containing protein n=1 Tax=Pleurostoma richardsiae TaxID=41990 RepID=A0AA38VBB3_9PEZI|nr:C6 zinc finger domain containing protein [Pleurostoma richardsiae]